VDEQHEVLARVLAQPLQCFWTYGLEAAAFAVFVDAETLAKTKDIPQVTAVVKTGGN